MYRYRYTCIYLYICIYIYIIGICTPRSPSPDCHAVLKPRLSFTVAPTWDTDPEKQPWHSFAMVVQYLESGLAAMGRAHDSLHFGMDQPRGSLNRFSGSFNASLRSLLMSYLDTQLYGLSVLSHKPTTWGMAQGTDGIRS